MHHPHRCDVPSQVDDEQALVQYFAKRLREWDAAAIAAYARRGFSRLPSGEGFRMRCEPESEASVYLGGMASSVYVHRLGELRCRVAIAAGETSMTLNAPSRTNLQDRRAGKGESWGRRVQS